jgi:integrase
MLTVLEVAKLKTPGRYADGGGLYLNVNSTGSKSWLFRYTKGTKPNRKGHWMGLGSIETYSLGEARERARWARQLIGGQRDPLTEKRAAQAALTVSQLKAMTFREAALNFLATDKIEGLKNDKARQQWRSTLEQYAFPVIGDLPLQSIDSALVLQALLPVWKRIPETGSRLRGRIERVFGWAMPLKLYEGPNPASREVLKDHLPAKAKAKHHQAVPYAELPAFMVDLKAREGMSAKALEFTILTAVRTNETIGAQWSEFDLEAAVWTIPAARMKAKRDHRVPLCKRAVEILRSAPQRGRKRPTTGHVFINGGGLPLSNMAMLELLRGMAPGTGYTVHGFRSSFSDWARDKTSYPRDVIEMALAHTIKDKSEAAYRRGDALDKRRELMGDWSGYLSK